MNETDYNARLYEKMKAEQDKYRDWLLHQEPSELLNHTYEYTMREDIVKPTDRSNTGSEHGATELEKSAVCMGCTFTTATGSAICRSTRQDNRITHESTTFSKKI